MNSKDTTGEGARSPRLRVVVGGRVQGVGFRYATYHKATELGLAGWVRNRPDGRVEAEFQGPPEAVRAMRDWCDRGPTFARVTQVEETWLPAEDASDSFEILG